MIPVGGGDGFRFAPVRLRFTSAGLMRIQNLRCSALSGLAWRGGVVPRIISSKHPVQDTRIGSSMQSKV